MCIRDSYKALPDMPFSQWANPYFTVDSPEQGDTFTIYQLKGGSETRDYRFEPYESLQEAGLAIDRQNYDLVYTAPRDGKTTLEDIFRTFNLDRPPDFTGHSLSVSDIVVLNRGGDTKAYYCDSAGFVAVSYTHQMCIRDRSDHSKGARLVAVLSRRPSTVMMSS